MQTTQTGSIILPDQGRELPGIVFKVPAAQAAGSFSIVEHPYEPGVLIPPHVHYAADQVTYVIDGEVGIRVGDDTFNAPAGTYVVKPRGIPHTHWNAKADPARVMEITTPGEFEAFFDDLGGLLAKGRPPLAAALNEIGERHATRFLMDWVPELTNIYGVRLLGN
jgi:quercetin dioxygenase-like cupin family protein